MKLLSDGKPRHTQQIVEDVSKKSKLTKEKNAKCGDIFLYKIIDYLVSWKNLLSCGGLEGISDCRLFLI